jgi:hypothetical protein
MLLRNITVNGEVSSVNIMLDGTMCPGQKLACFVLCKKSMNVNKTHQLIPGIGTTIFGVMEPHCSAVLEKQRVVIKLPSNKT